MNIITYICKRANSSILELALSIGTGYPLIGCSPAEPISVLPVLINITNLITDTVQFTLPYEYLDNIKPAKNNITDFFKLFTDKFYIGINSSDILRIFNQRHDTISLKLLNFLKSRDCVNFQTLIVYYVGHGIRQGINKELFLTGINSHPDDVHSTCLSYYNFKSKIEQSHFFNKIIILDACYSGLANQGEIQIINESDIIIQGSYVLCSSASDEKTFFKTSNRNTFFASDFLNSIIKGNNKLEPYISLEDIYQYLYDNKKYSTPKRASNLTTSDFSLFKNVSYSNINPVNNIVPMNTSTENNGFYSENNFSKEDGKLKYPVIIVLILGVILAAFFLFLIFFKF